MSSRNIRLTTNIFEVIREVELLDLGDINQAKEIFDLYVEKGVFLNSDFSNNHWIAYDQYDKVVLNLRLNEIAYRRSSLFNNIKFNEFCLYLKMFTVGLFGTYVIKSIQTFLRELKDVINTFDGRHIKSNTQFQEASIILDFLDIINLQYTDEYEYIVAELESVMDSQKNNSTPNRRQLSTFQSYFKFTDILNVYWNSPLTNKEQVFYFPIYLWWNITSILPLRPREFLLIPRDCFRDKSNKNVITFRRTTLKGSKKKVNYSIDEDYELCSYDVGDTLGNQIRKYISLTSNMESNSIDTLLRADHHYNYFGKVKRYDSRLFSYANMRYCLKRFYSEVLQEQYKIRIVNKKNINNDPDCEDVYSLEHDEIEFINIGDTRHIAMINIIASGGTATTAMLLAGHSNIDISSHYFANISTLLECKTYQAYKKSIDTTKKECVMNINFLPLISSQEYMDFGNGARCYSAHFKNGDYYDCIKSVGENGELGECYNCDYYRDNDYRIFVDDKEIFTTRLTRDCDFLAKQINLVRQSKGYEEDIKQALLRLQNSTKSYEKYFYSKLSNGGN
jgi:hypothetical protein